MQTYILDRVDFTAGSGYVQKKEHGHTRPATEEEAAFLAHWQDKLGAIFSADDGRPLEAYLVSRSEGLAGKGPF